MFAPEFGLFAILILHLVFDLFQKIESGKFIRSLILGLVLIFVPLALMFSYGGTGLYGLFKLNPLATFLKMIFLFSAIATLWMTKEFSLTLGKRSNDFCLIVVTALLGSFFLASSNDLITLFISVEWITISLYILAAFLKEDLYSIEAGVKYLVVGAFSSALFLYGISLVYGGTGHLVFSEIKQALASGPNLYFAVGFFLILAGIGFKIAMFPFQLWVPDVYEGSPTPVTAFLSTASKTAGFAALLKVLFLVSLPLYVNWPFLLTLVSAITLVYGNLAALRQTNMKRLFAYSSISHAGYLLMGVACANRMGLEATLYYLLAYVISNAAAFLVIVIANREINSGEIQAYRGFAKKSPYLSAVFFIALLSLGGIPPLAGFFGKFLILNALVLKGYLWLAILGAVNVIISLFYYLSLVKEIYFRPAASEEQVFLTRATKIFLFCLAAAIIILGVFPQSILRFIQISASVLLIS